jgi:hypothetical protein
MQFIKIIYLFQQPKLKLNIELLQEYMPIFHQMNLMLYGLIVQQEMMFSKNLKHIKE